MSVNNQIKTWTIDSGNWQIHEKLLQNLSQLAAADRHKASENLLWDNWQTNTSSLMYAIVVDKRFDSPTGQFNLLTIDEIPVACGGCSISDWSDQIMVLGVRTWTNPKNRDHWWHGDILLPIQYELAKSFGCIAVALTFNEYSMPLKKFIQRIIQGKAVSFGVKNANFYKDLIFYNENYLIKNTIQTIAVKLLNCNQSEFENKYLPPRADV